MRAAATVLLAFFLAGHAFAANHLAGEKSEYLHRASNQPVDWYPFGPEAFAKARGTHKPILLDVGAVWCAWCTQMDRESYTDPETAAYINSHFVPVKVDFDNAGELAAQLSKAQAVLNLPVGLPLTCFMTADGVLFDGAAYLPPHPTAGKPSIKQAMDSALAHFADPAYVDQNGFRLKNVPH